MLLQPERYNSPTHFNVPHTITFSLLGCKIGLTLRQLGILVIGMIGSDPLCKTDATGFALLDPLILPSLLFCLTPIFALYRFEERGGEDGLLVISFFLATPRISIWHLLSCQERTRAYHEELQ